MHEHNLYQIVYGSSGVREFSEDEIEDILAVSRRNNTRDNLSGMLLYEGGNFLQVLEGPWSAIHKTMARIRLDERHRGIVVIQERLIAQRGFSEWAMGFRRLRTNGKEVEGYSPFMEHAFETDVFRDDPDFAYRMLVQFKDKIR